MADGKNESRNDRTYDISSVRTSSMSLNTQKGDGAEKPMMSGGNHSPGGTKPPREHCAPVPMPK